MRRPAVKTPLFGWLEHEYVTVIEACGLLAGGGQRLSPLDRERWRTRGLERLEGFLVLRFKPGMSDWIISVQ